jgi:hypothetical protein
MNTPWTATENALIVAEYLTMLRLELNGKNFIKAERNRAVRSVLPNRSKGSVEFKHQNISAVLMEHGRPYIAGYRPANNYQESLRRVVLEAFDVDPELNSLSLSFVDADATLVLPKLRVADVLVARPERSPPVRSVYERVAKTPVVVGAVDYLERESRNATLGRKGELFVLEFEHQRLWEAGRKDLAERIEHVSAVHGDGLGYDIASFERDGRELLIEAKATRFGILTPFFASRREVAFSQQRSDVFSVYRVFEIERSPKLFTLPGALDVSCVLDPVQYRATTR